MASPQSTSHSSASMIADPATTVTTSTTPATTATATATTTPPSSSTSFVPPLPDGPDPYCLGSTFPCLDAFRDALLAHTVHRRLSYKVAKCSWYAYVVTCRDPHCSFKIRGVYARKPEGDTGYNGPAAGPLPSRSSDSNSAPAPHPAAADAAAAAAATAENGDIPHPQGPDSFFDVRPTPVIYPPSNPSDAHPDYHWRVSIAIPHSHNCSQDHSSWKHAISYLKRGGQPARRSVQSRNGFGIGRPRIGGIVIPGPDDPQKLQQQLQQRSRDQRLQHQAQGQQARQQQQQQLQMHQSGGDDRGQARDDASMAYSDYSLRGRFSARAPASKRQKLSNPSAVQMVAYYFEDENQQQQQQQQHQQQLDMSHHPFYASGGGASHGNATPGGASAIPPNISAEASFYLLSTLRYDPSFTTRPESASHSPSSAHHRQFKNPASSTQPPVMDIDAAAHQSPYYLLPYHVARLLAGARAFGWTKAVEALSDGYGAARWGSKNASLTGLEKLVRALDAKCQQESQSPQQQQQQSQPDQTPGVGEDGGSSNVDGGSGAGNQPLRVRILLSSTGRIDVQTNPLPTKVNEHIFFLNPPAATPSLFAYSSAQPQPPFTFASLRQLNPHITPWEVRLDTQSVTPSLFTRHKSTERGEYTASRRRVGITGPNGMEVLLWNHNGEIMEGSVCSVYFRRPVAQHDQQYPNHSDHHDQPPQPQQQQQGDTIMGGTDPGTNGSGLPDNSSSNLGLNVPTSAPQEQDDHSPMPLPPPTMAPQVSAAPFTARDLWVTPPLSSGCNASTTRAYALASGMCREESVKTDSIVDGEEVWLSNGLRGFIPGIIKIRWAEVGDAENVIY